MQGNTFYFNWEPQLMEWLQNQLGSAGKAVGSFLSLFGEETLLILIFGFIYWCYNKKMGLFIGINMIMCLVWNPILKNVALRRRPYMDHSGIKCLKPINKSTSIYDVASQGYSFPSGHSTNAATVYASIALFMKKKIFWIVGITLAVLVGISRVILGMHYPTDVLCGWLMGAVIVAVFSYIQQKIKRKGLFYFGTFIISSMGIFFCTSDDYFTTLGMMGGAFVANLFEEKYINFENTKSIPRIIARLAGGMMIYLVFNSLLKMPFTKEFLESGTNLAHLVRFARYFIILFLMLGLYPITFDKIGKKDKANM